jgi:nucleoid-associated protein YgaU
MVVSQGDTLWDIARTLKPEGSLGDLVGELVRLNGARLEPGQVVRLP